jgi:hypothetical protein
VAFAASMSYVVIVRKCLSITDFFLKKSLSYRYYSNFLVPYIFVGLSPKCKISSFSCVSVTCNAFSQLCHFFPTVPSERMDTGLTVFVCQSGIHTWQLLLS